MGTLFSRDSWLWAVLFWAGMTLNLTLGVIMLDAGGPAAYGIPPLAFKWLLLINSVVTGIAGKAGMSPAELARNMTGGKP